MSSFPIHLTRLLEAVIPLTDLQPSGVPPAGAGAPGAGCPHRLEDDGEAGIRHLDHHCASLQHCPLVRDIDLHFCVQISVCSLLQVLCIYHAWHSLLQRPGGDQV